MNLGELIAAVKSEGGFDTTTGPVSDATITSWLQNAVDTLVAESQWIKATVELGPTVAGTSAYVVPDGVLDIRQVVVDGLPYLRVGPTDLFDLRASRSYIASGYGAFAPGYNATGSAVVDLWPTPETSGDTITALASTSAPTMSASTDVPAVPEDFHQALVDKAIGTGLRRIYERHDDADRIEVSFDNPAGKPGAVQKLKRRANSRIGSGPTRVRLG